MQPIRALESRDVVITTCTVQSTVFQCNFLLSGKKKHSSYVMHHNGKILHDCQSVKLGYETGTPALRYLYKNSSKDFVPSTDLCPFFLPHCRMLQAHTCLYSPSPSWALNCHADWWLGKSCDTLGCIRMQNITVTAGVCGICMRVCVC